ncbi:FUSC family protein, partial [uncultured Microbacterium sp.]|uniref:FUSC family protein n=1 Tax=uncultured Microbacterium sp. TaxID=191216 RepID=UPI0026149BBA
MGRISDVIGARDPGRARLVSAVSVVTGVLASALFASSVIRVLHADGAFLVMGVFLSMLAGNVVKGPSPASRSVTAALLPPVIVATVLVASSLSAWRPAMIGVFVLLAGISMWLRRFGPRATAIGTIAFFTFFFTLFMHPTAAELPVYCLIAAGAATTQLLVRLFLMLRRPRRQLEVLLAELRVASAAALHAATRPEHRRTVRRRLARLDAVGQAITTWQHDYPTARYTDVSERDLGELALDARAYVEEVCDELVRGGSAPPTLPSLLAVLDPHAAPGRVAAAGAWAERAENGGDLIAQSTRAHFRLRAIEVSGDRQSAIEPQPERAPVSTANAEPSASWRAWRQWAPTTRLAVQASIAALIATGVGEAISASRWYWAVLTAFLVFMTATTRSNILTRAYRRIIGTVLGIAVGALLAYLAHGNSIGIIAICAIAIFGMLYFGPLNYAYSSFFVTVMLIALFDMLGVLNRSLIELRIEETVVGAVIGVLCAYLILSSSSKPALLTKIGAYFDALDDLLRAGDDTIAARAPNGGRLASVRALDAAQAGLDQTVAAMSTAFLVGRRQAVEESALHLMHFTTLSATRFSQLVREGKPGPVADASAVREAITAARAAAERTRARLERGRDDAETVPAAVEERRDDRRDGSPAIMALTRIEWAMTR